MKDSKDIINAKLVDLLNETLKLEYSFIIHYPRISNAIRDEGLKKLAQALGTASIKHADTVANAIKKLGGKAEWSFEAIPDEDDLVKVFRKQLEKEREALRVYTLVAGMALDRDIKEKLKVLAEEEKGHISTVERILTTLEKSVASDH